MSEIERARQQLSISGYKHPEIINFSKNKIYKTFNPKSKPEDTYKNNKQISIYKTFTDSTLDNLCPSCGSEALLICDCEWLDKQCKNGHIWYINKDEIHLGDPHD